MSQPPQDRGVRDGRSGDGARGDGRRGDARSSDHRGRTVGRAAREAELRAQRRAFIRANHPDVGGDPEAFLAGLARFDGGHPAGGVPRSGSPDRDSRPLVRRSRRPDRIVRQKLRELHRRLTGKPPRTLH